MAQLQMAQRRQAVLVRVLAGLVVLSGVTLVVQLFSFLATGHGQTVAWMGVDAAVGATFAGLWRAAERGRSTAASFAVVALFGGLTVMLLITDGSDHPMWAVLSVFTIALATLLLESAQALAVAAAGGLVVLPLVVLQETGAVHPVFTEREATGSHVATVVEILILLGVLAAIFRVYTRDVLLAPAETPVPVPERTRDLTPREVEVVRLIADGHGNDAIAAALVVSPRTVHSHVTNALRKCGCANRTELGVLAVREGLVPPTGGPSGATARTP